MVLRPSRDLWSKDSRTLPVPVVPATRLGGDDVQMENKLQILQGKNMKGHIGTSSLVENTCCDFVPFLSVLNFLRCRNMSPGWSRKLQQENWCESKGLSSFSPLKYSHKLGVYMCILHFPQIFPMANLRSQDLPKHPLATSWAPRWDVGSLGRGEFGASRAAAAPRDATRPCRFQEEMALPRATWVLQGNPKTQETSVGRMVRCGSPMFYWHRASRTFWLWAPATQPLFNHQAWHDFNWFLVTHEGKIRFYSLAVGTFWDSLGIVFSPQICGQNSPDPSVEADFAVQVEVLLWTVRWRW